MPFIKPNLFIIGAMKSGTTYLSKLLRSHPAVFICCPEEPSYFVDSKQLRIVWPEMWDKGYWRSEEGYLRLFQFAEYATVIGEASTNYTKLPMIPHVPCKIKKFNPDARLIYLLRDPVERTISHYWHMVRHHAEHRQIFEAIKQDFRFRDVSYYAMQLTPYLESFGEKRIEILTFEELTRRPNATMRRLYTWLRLDVPSAASMVDEPENVTPKVVNMATSLGAMRWLRESRMMRSVLPRVPSAVRRAGVRLTTRQVNRGAVDTSEVTKFLRPFQQRQTEELTQLLGRTFPEWNTLYERSPDYVKELIGESA